MFEAVLSGVQADITAEDAAEDQSTNFLVHAIAHRALKRLAVENTGDVWTFG